MDIENIKGDLQAFADPRSAVTVSGNLVSWEQDGRERKVRLVRGHGADNLQVEVRGRRMPYVDFLAGPRMANLSQLSDFMVRTLPELDPYIDTSASVDETESAKIDSGSALDLIANLTETQPAFSTRLLLIRGEAGAGKTVCLKELARRRALSFRGKPAGPLFFYVNAQGRALSMLEDVISRELDDLRARFIYAAVPVLTRHRLLIPIIDGFDELLGSGGYDDAFSSLANFLSVLDSSGTVVASARSTFFDYTGLRESAEKFQAQSGFIYEPLTLTVHDWTEGQIEDYFARAAGTLENDIEVRKQLKHFKEAWAQKDFMLLRKPFYSAQVVELLRRGQSLDQKQRLLQQLVNAFLEREMDKLRDQNDRPLLTISGHRMFIEGLAEEMWWQENRSVDVTTVKLVAELTAEEQKVAPSVARALVERVSAYAFLTTDGTKGGGLRFEHEVFYSFFLAIKLARHILMGGASLRRFLTRAVVESTLVGEASRRIDRSSMDLALRNLCGATSPRLTDTMARENAGKLAAEILRDCGPAHSGLSLENLVLRGEDLAGLEIENVVLRNCDTHEIDLSRTRVSRLVLSGSILRETIVDLRTTTFVETEIDIEQSILGLVVRDSQTESAEALFNPGEIAAALSSMGVDVVGYQESAPSELTESQKQVARSINRISRWFDRQFYYSDSELSRRQRQLECSLEHLVDLLVQAGVAEKTFINKAGTKEEFLRLLVPPELLRRGENTNDSSVPTEVRRLWNRVLT